MRVEIKWKGNKNGYRVARVSPQGRVAMYVYYHHFSDALKHAEYFNSFGDVE